MRVGVSEIVGVGRIQLVGVRVVVYIVFENEGGYTEALWYCHPHVCVWGGGVVVTATGHATTPPPHHLLQQQYDDDRSNTGADIRSSSTFTGMYFTFSFKLSIMAVPGDKRDHDRQQRVTWKSFTFVEKVKIN